MATLYNPTPGSVVLPDGTLIGAGERVDSEVNVAGHLEAGRLIKVGAPAPAPAPAVSAPAQTPAPQAEQTKGE